MTVGGQMRNGATTRLRHRLAGSASAAVLTGPGLTAYSLFVLIPVGIAVWYSLTDWNGFSASPSFVGLDNFARALGDRHFAQAAWVTGAIAVVGVVLLNVVGLVFAVMLEESTLGNRLLRGVVFFPIVLSPLVVGFVWKALLNYEGLVNSVLASFGIDPVNFLGEPQLAVASIAMVTYWQVLGFVMVLYLAALRTIPTDINDAVAIDGAGAVDRFRYITVPLVAPATTATTILLLIYFMRLYDYVAVMTFGGPGGATETLAYDVVRTSFNANQYGYGSALAIVLLIAVAVVSAIFLRVLVRREEPLG